jgi:exodeoxyribonuclease V gamma subunit
MIRLCYSNRTEELLRALAADLKSGAGARGIFQPVPLVVPNPQIETYVKLGVARENGVAAHIETRYLRGHLASVVAASAPNVAIVERPAIEGELLGLLQDEKWLALEELGPVRAYLAAGGDAPDALDLRRYQLAAELARLFDDYAFARPELLNAWREGRTLPDDAAGAPAPEKRGVEVWERAAWLALFGRGGAFERRGRAEGRRYVDLPRFFSEARPRDLVVPPATYVFGLSYVARLYRDILAALGQSGEVYLYTLNPCREYWEDLEHGRAADRARFPKRRAGVQLSLLPDGPAEASEAPPPETPALALWARPGRENIALHNTLSDCDFVSRFADPLEGAAAPGTVLAHLQHDILDRVPARAGKARLQLTDDSVSVLPCPNPRRELETIAAQIWRLVGPELTFTDVAIVVPPGSAETYLPLASAVLRESSELPHTIIDAPTASGSRVLEATALLLGLPLSPLGRPDLLRLLMHPCVARRFPDADPRDWLALAEELDIVRGADRSEHAGTYVEGDRFNWDQGIRRLALGAFLAGPRSGEEQGFVMNGERYLPAELSPELQASAQGLGALARGLIAFAARARGARLTVPEWMAELRRELAAVIVTSDDDGEEGALGRVLAELQRIEAAAPAGLRVGYRIVHEQVKAGLAALPSRGGRYLTHGVTVSTFLPMRAVPFRVVFLAGMGEGRFPARDRAAELDLRAGALRHLPGDVSPREQDQYMFLETLLCTRDRLVVSYVDRDEVSGEELGPSSTVADLLDILAAGYVRAGREAMVRAAPPLRRDEDDAACSVIPAAARERRAARIGRALQEAAGGRTLPEWPTLRTALAPEALAEVGAALGWAAPRLTAVARVRPRRLLTARHILRFLECPLQGSALALLPLGSDDGTEEAAAAFREHEDFELARPRALSYLRDALALAYALDRAGADAAFARAYERTTAAAALDGTLPHGAFGDAVRTQHLTLLLQWRDTLAQRGGVESQPARAFVGHGPEGAGPVRILPAPVVTLDGRAAVEIHGETNLLLAVGGAPATVLLAASATRERGNGRDKLRAFVDHLLLAASDPEGAPRRRGFVLRPDQDDPEEFWLRPLAQADALAFLGRLSAEILGGVHPYFFPCEGVLGWEKKAEPRPELLNYIHMLREDDWTRFTSDWGPIPNARDYPLPKDEQTALQLVEDRFRLYLDTLEPAEAAEADRGAS